MNTNPFQFKPETPNEIKQILIAANQLRTRLRFWYGDIETGEAWAEELDVCGVVGKSTGIKPIPLLIRNANSHGGPALMECIVKIVNTQTKAVLYQHPNFKQGVFTNKGADLYKDGVYHGKNKSEASAIRWCDFMNGKRMNP